MVQDPQNEAAGEDQWMVAIAPGNVQMMDVEQLDAAYQAGQINDNTMVWTQGMDAWLPLSQVIGGDSGEAEPGAANAPAAQRPAPAPAAVTQQLGGQLEVQQQVDATQRAWQEQADAAAAAAFAAAQQAPVQAAPSVLAPSAFAPAAPVQAFAAPAARAAQPAQAFGGQAFGGQAFGAQGFGAQAAPAQGFAGFGAPMPAQPVAFAQPAFAPSPAQPSGFPSVAAPGAPGPSTAPMALNLDSLDLGSMDMPKKKSKLGLLAAAALVLGAGGVTAMNLGGAASAEKAPNAVAAAAAAGAVEGGEKAVAKNDPNAPLDMGGSYEVTEAEKKAFAKEAEQQQEMRDKMAAALTGPNGEKADTSGKAAAPSAAAAKGALKAKFGGGGGAAKKAKGGGGSGLSKGGSSFDPLNGDL